MGKFSQRKSADTDCTQITQDSYENQVRYAPKRMSLGAAIKKSVTMLACVIPSSSTSRHSEISNFDDGMDQQFDYEVEEVEEKDLDLFEMIQFDPWKSEDRAKYDDDAVYWYATLRPRSFRVRYDFGKQSGRGSLSCFPLQRIVALGASLRTVETVARAYPPALVKRHHLNRSNVLHSACAFPSPFQVGVIEFLLDHNLPAVSQTNRHAFLPIHNACSASLPSPIGLEAIQILVESYPESILQRNKLGETPLQAARRNTESLQDVLCYLEEIQQQQQEQQT